MSVVGGSAAAALVPPISGSATAASAAAPVPPPLQQRTTTTTTGAATAAATAKSMGLDLIAGTAAGTAQLLVGHPFDTVKVKMQSSSQYRGPLDAARQTLRQEGVKGLYRGMSAPLATVALFNAVLFSARGQAQAVLQQRRRRRNDDGANGDGSAAAAAAAGAMMGDELVAALAASAAVSLVATPTELLKCRLQAQGDATLAAARLRASGAANAAAAGAAATTATTIYRGPADVARHVLRYEGGARGLFKGLNATLTREALGNLAMFGVYHAVKDALSERRGIPTAQLPFSDLLLAGGLGGTAFWLACYPTDVVKSKLQLDSYARPQYKGMLDCARQLVAHGGAAALWRGFGPALARSFPANAVCFATYEGVAGLLRGGDNVTTSDNK